MTDDDFFGVIDPVFKTLGAVPAEGEEFQRPALDVLRYYERGVKLHWLPVLGRGLSIVAVVRQPVDLGLSVKDYRDLLKRLGMVVNGRFPPWGTHSKNWGIALGLTAIILTPEPIKPEDDAILRQVVNGKPLAKQRAVPLGLFRVNLGQEALSFAMATGPAGVFLEPAALADALTTRLKRFVPIVDV